MESRDQGSGGGRFILHPRSLWVVFGLLLLIFLHWRLHRYTAVDYASGAGPDVQAQLNWIGAELRRGGGDRTQAWYPEGYFFTHAIYGYTLVNQALLEADDVELRGRNIQEIEWVLARLESEAGRRPFARHQSVEYGVFYLGWSNKLLGGLLLLQPEEERDPERVAQFHAQSHALADAFLFSPAYHLEAYPGGCWPVDNIVALSSLRLHDHLYDTDYGEIVDGWVTYMREHVDPATGLIPHQIDAVTGRHWEGARGSSMILSLVFLPEIEPEFAREQYGRFREQYAQPLLGFVFTREYPHGVRGRADVDSGPLVFGLGPVATGVSIASSRANGDVEIFERIVQLSEVVGLPITWAGKKRYSLGLLLPGDAFEVWGKTIVPWRLETQAPPPADYPRLTPRFHTWAYGMTAVMLMVLFLRPLRSYGALYVKSET